MAAISAEKRSAFLPNVPTFKELGYPVVYESWSALFVRSDTPAPIVAKLRTALAQVMASPTTQDAMKTLNVAPADGKLEDLPKVMEKELAEYTEDQTKQGILPQ